MARTSRNDGLNYKAIWVNGKPVRKSLVHRTWTKIAIDCYNRGCNCYGCDLIPQLDSLSKCQVKDYVMAYIKMGYYPKESEENTDG